MTLRLAVDADDDFIKGKAQRWKIELASNEPFGVASLWDTLMDPSTGKVVNSFTILTVNADEHPVMKQFHKPSDEKKNASCLIA